MPKRDFSVANDEDLTRRFYILSAVASLALLFTIVLSISQFGGGTWAERAKVGFILDSSQGEGLGREEYLGLKQSAETLGYELLVRESTPAEHGRTAAELVGQGASLIIFAQSDELGEDKILSPEVDYWSMNPGKHHAPGVKLYFVSYHDSHYLAGALAGLRTKTGRIGYIASVFDNIAFQNINSYALGAQAVNPAVQVFLVMTGNDPAKEELAVQTMKVNRADVLAYKLSTETVPKAADRLGIAFVGFNIRAKDYNSCLANIETDWHQIYKYVLEHSHEGLLPVLRENQAGLANFIPCPGRLTSRERAVVDDMRWRLNNGQNIFSGPIYDRSGNLRLEADTTMGRNAMIGMNWLIRGVTVLGN